MHSDLDPDEPSSGGAAPSSRGDDSATSVFVEVRRARAERRATRSIALRIVGLAVIALAAWVISRNVTWADTLRIETRLGAVEIDGSIEGDWRADSVEFVIDRDGVDGPTQDTILSAGLSTYLRLLLYDAALEGDRLRVDASGIRSPDGSEVVAVGSELEGPEGSRERVKEVVTRLEWRPGMLRLIREIRVDRLLPALAFLVLASLCVATRWWRLLALSDCPTRWYDAFRYTYAGLFFNTVVPGFNGGDVARAVAVVRNHPDRRADALMTVVVDRAVGLIAMIVIGTAFVLSADERLDAVKLPVAAFCALILVGGALFCSRRVRAALGFDRIVGRLPQGDRLLRLDAAAQHLMRRPLDMAIALAFSFANHLFNGLAVMAAAGALGSALGFADWMSVMAIANTLSAVPISPGGLGVGEVLYGSLARSLGATYAIGVATSLVYRLCLYALSLLGGLVMLLPSRRPDEQARTGGANTPEHGVSH
ncbi:MAG: lysylphosphatidylglycerol synthase transmembrane domain-containing protein [Planctomycetota bacterium]